MPTALPHRRLAALALALIVALALVACGGSDGGSEGGGGGDMQVDVADGGQDMVVEGDGVTVAVDQGDGVAIPDSWPAEVPKPEGQPTAATAGEFEGTDGWMVNYGQADAAAFDAYVAALASAGAESTASLDQAGLRSEAFTVGGYGVTVQLIDGIGMTVNVIAE